LRKSTLLVGAALVLVGIGLAIGYGLFVKPDAGGPSGRPATAAELDKLLAPIALYPDQLLAQMLLCATDPTGVMSLDQFLKNHATLKGTDLQDAALKDNFEPSFVALSLFPKIVSDMVSHLNTTTRIGQAFTADRSAVFDSIQRLRMKAHDVGTLKSTPQQEVETKTTSTGQQVIVIEPANPQVIYVPTYNPETVYVQNTTVVVKEDNSAEVAVAGLIGFTAGIAIGASMNNNYYYGPYGWHGGAYMYNDAWDDYYDHREDAREDWQDHREDLVEERGDRASNNQEQRTERTEARQENRPDNQAARQESRADTQARREQAGTATQSASTASRSAGGAYEARGKTSTQATERTATQERSGTSSDAFSGYSNGASERAASTRGQSSRSSAGTTRSSSSRSTGSRSAGGGGRRR